MRRKQQAHSGRVFLENSFDRLQMNILFLLLQKIGYAREVIESKFERHRTSPGIGFCDDDSLAGLVESDADVDRKRARAHPTSDAEEADDFALAHLKQLDRSADDFAKAMQGLLGDIEEQSQADNLEKYFSTHPALIDRINKAKQAAEQETP